MFFVFIFISFPQFLDFDAVFLNEGRVIRVALEPFVHFKNLRSSAPYSVAAVLCSRIAKVTAMVHPAIKANAHDTKIKAAILTLRICF